MRIFSGLISLEDELKSLFICVKDRFTDESFVSNGDTTEHCTADKHTKSSRTSSYRLRCAVRDLLLLLRFPGGSSLSASVGRVRRPVRIPRARRCVGHRERTRRDEGYLDV